MNTAINTTEYKTLGICCPVFNPELWDEKVHIWKEKHFIKSTFPAIFHFPIPPILNRGINKMISLATADNKLYPIKEEALMLFSDPSPFKEEVYMSVTDDVKGANNISLTGTFLSKVYKGGFRDTGKFVKKMESYIRTKGIEAKKIYVHYAYCPKCSKEAGTNYVVVFAEADSL